MNGTCGVSNASWFPLLLKYLKNTCGLTAFSSWFEFPPKNPWNGCAVITVDATEISSAGRICSNKFTAFVVVCVFVTAFVDPSSDIFNGGNTKAGLHRNSPT